MSPCLRFGPFDKLLVGTMKESKQGIGASELKRTVLVVEDNELNREVLCALLEDEFHIIEAENGLVGLERLEQHYKDISLILLDVYMPVCDGFEFLERKRQDARFDSLPVIITTGSGTTDDEIRCLELGANDFILKSSNRDVMKNRIRSVIRLRESAAKLNLVETDPLTGLYNREIFFYEMGRILRAEESGEYDIVCSDVENFRAMNEIYGREASDAFLRAAAEHLSALMPGLVLAGRLSDDVFAFLIKHQQGTWADRLAFGDELDGKRNYTINFGIYPHVDKSLTPSVACDRAIFALQTVQYRFSENTAWYLDDVHEKRLRRHRIEEEMQFALENTQFSVHYQPKHDIHTDGIGGAEALARWFHPELGSVSPREFISIFEHNGFITQLDFYVWEEVCREIRRCIDQGLEPVPISVNVSRIDFELPDLATRISQLVDSYGIDHSLLHIEITESVFSDCLEQIDKTLVELHDDGFIIELDDFGVGYSNFTSLFMLTLDIMKLDLGLVRYATEVNDFQILRSAIMLADSMGLKIVAEGVETAEQAAALKVLGCDYIQGYYYSPPLCADDFETYLKDHSR